MEESTSQELEKVWMMNDGGLPPEHMVVKMAEVVTNGEGVTSYMEGVTSNLEGLEEVTSSIDDVTSNLEGVATNVVEGLEGVTTNMEDLPPDHVGEKVAEGVASNMVGMVTTIMEDTMETTNSNNDRAMKVAIKEALSTTNPAPLLFSIHVLQPIDNLEGSCQLCKQVFSSARGLALHVTSSHTNKPSKSSLDVASSNSQKVVTCLTHLEYCTV